ncbi:MAG: ribosomal protein S18-alanine N-acetyltransferase [Firmicutes bacterium]|nr:ribosomal protein S18-alanine N-acetyltransferase [Bacillota bacterium]
MTEIFKMTKDDADGAAEIDRRCFSVPWSKKSFLEEAENGIAVYFIAKDGEKYVGYGGFWNVYPEGDITNVAVVPDYRRQGIATAILKEMIKKARVLKLNCLNLEVRRSNHAAQRLYAEFGFEVAGERKRYYSDNREDALIMKLNL